MNKPTDKEMLDWLDKNTRGYGNGWICRDSTTGRGLRLHQISKDEAFSFGKEVFKTVREAIADAMDKGLSSEF